MPFNRPVKATQCGLPVPTGFFLHVGLLYLRKGFGADQPQKRQVLKKKKKLGQNKKKKRGGWVRG